MRERTSRLDLRQKITVKWILIIIYLLSIITVTNSCASRWMFRQNLDYVRGYNYQFVPLNQNITTAFGQKYIAIYLPYISHLRLWLIVSSWFFHIFLMAKIPLYAHKSPIDIREVLELKGLINQLCYFLWGS